MNEAEKIPEEKNTTPSKPTEQSGPQPSADSRQTKKDREQLKEDDIQSVTDPQPEISNQKTEIENMEVHHPHHVTHKKKWGEYLLEFFMLFLAVFLGFVAENQREHGVEKNREKQFIQSLVNDIKADTARIKVIINQRNIREQRLDSLSFLMNSDSPEIVTNIIYYNAVTAARSQAFRFIPNDGTMQQLKNSGAFRLIRNHSVADSIARYDVSVRNFLRQAEIEEVIISDFRGAAAFIFDALVFDRHLDQDNNVRMPNENPQLLDYSKETLHTWNYKMYSMKAINKAGRRDLRLLFRQAANLLKTLKTEYHLE